MLMTVVIGIRSSLWTKHIWSFHKFTSTGIARLAHLQVRFALGLQIGLWPWIECSHIWSHSDVGHLSYQHFRIHKWLMPFFSISEEKEINISEILVLSLMLWQVFHPRPLLDPNKCCQERKGLLPITTNEMQQRMPLGGFKLETLTRKQISLFKE